MTSLGLVQLLISIVLALTGLISAISVFYALVLRSLHTEVKEMRIHINSRMDELVATTMARGRLEGAAMSDIQKSSLVNMDK